MKKINLLAATAVVALTAFGAQAADSTTSAMSGMFIQKASVGGNFEIQSSQIALQKSQNPEIKSFAQEMINDHGKANDDLKATVSDEGLDSSKLNSGVDAKHQAILDKLNADSAVNFDADYIKAQKDAHVETIALLQKYSSKGDDAGLKAFAIKTLPVVKGHAQHVKELQSASN